MLGYKDLVFGSLLGVAAEVSTTNKKLFEAIFDTVREKLPEEVPTTTPWLRQHNDVWWITCSTVYLVKLAATFLCSGRVS